MLQLMSSDTNMFNSQAEAWVNTVNCAGVMGAGIALEFKTRFPLMFADYKNKCNLRILKPGHVYIYSNDTLFPKFILNISTKDDWKNNSELQWIESALIELSDVCKNFKISTVALPALGCGLGGLNFCDVTKLYQKYLVDDKTIYQIYTPR